MSVPVCFSSWLLAVSPVLMLLLCLFLHFSSLRSGFFALLCCVLYAVLYFRADMHLITVDIIKDTWNALPIVAVIWSVILLYSISKESGAMDCIGGMLKKITSDELLQVLMISSVAASFLQGITGYGVPIAVCAPLLIAIGVKPFWAVVLPLLGHAWGNTFGALAMAWDALATEGGVSTPEQIRQTVLLSAILIWFWNFFALVIICWLYGGKAGVKHGFSAVLAISLSQGGGELLFTMINTTLACFIPCIIKFSLNARFLTFPQIPVMKRYESKT